MTFPLIPLLLSVVGFSPGLPPGVVMPQNVRVETGNSSPTLSVTPPAGTEPGDTLILFATSTNRNGWHSISPAARRVINTGADAGASGSPKLTVFVYQVGEVVPPSFTFSISGNFGATAMIGCFRHPKANIGAVSQTTTYVNATSLTAPSVDVLTPGATLLAWFVRDNSTVAMNLPAGMLQQFGSSAAGNMWRVGSEIREPGATGPRTVTDGRTTLGLAAMLVLERA
jgi:hypothetical protein